jgi:hypothetical protein
MPASNGPSIRAAKRATPAERAEEFRDEQARLKREATERREAKAERLAATPPRKRSSRSGT